MPTKDKVTLWMQFVALVITIGTLAWQQSTENNLQEQAEFRESLKLQIFNATKDKEFSEDDIIKRLSSNNPAQNLNPADVKKTIYQMLVEKTITLTDAGKYQAQLLAPFEKEKRFELALELSKKWDSHDLFEARNILREHDRDISKIPDEKLADTIAKDSKWDAALREVFNYFHDISATTAASITDSSYLEREFSSVYTEKLYKTYQPWLDRVVKNEDQKMYEDLARLNADWLNSQP